MTEKTVFTSPVSFQEAAFQAQMNGYTPVGQARNRSGEFVVFAQRRSIGGWI